MACFWTVIGAVACLLAANTASAQAVSARARQDAKPDVRLVGSPTWWVIPFQEGNAAEGKLYFGATVENRSASVARVGVSFQSYLADGRRFDGCHAMGGDGPGVATELAPRGRAFVVCNRSVVTLQKVDGLQVTSRIWDVQPVSVRTVQAQVIDSGLEVGEAYSDAVEYDAYARIASRSSHDIAARVVFRFLAADGSQLEMCESSNLIIEPEVAVRATCWGGGVSIPKGGPQPASVEAELRAHQP